MSLLAITSKKKKKDSNRVSPVLPDIPGDEVQLSESAVLHIRNLLAERELANGVFRIGIVGGGCSGLSYHFAIEESTRATDRLFEQDGVRYCVDPKSLKVIGGSMLDWHEEIGRRGFRLLNKQSVKNCSCGESFSFG